MYIHRKLEDDIQKYLQIFPVIAILGPRQCGKSTIIKQLFSNVQTGIYLDLQNQEDLNKLTDPRLFFKNNQEKVICLDEIQLVPELFGVLRSVIDENRINGKFILLGSASRDLIQKSSESLAGRIGFLNLTPFLINEINTTELNVFWNRGAYPNSLLVENDEFSTIWRENYIKTYVERDIPQLGFDIPALKLRRFLTMCAHNHGQTLNLSKMASSMDLTHPTIRKYIDIFEQTFVLRSLPPYELNVKKRMVKSPKIYVRDSGILHQLLRIKNMDNLFSHPIFGASWEGLVIEQLLSNLNCQAYFYRTATGDEIDLVLELNNKVIAIECKASTSPQLTKGSYRALELINPDLTYIVAPIDSALYQIQEKIFVGSISSVLDKLLEIK
jgi:predicted AAA+ superfamily ATPase